MKPSGVADDLRRWREAVDDNAGYDELVLWFEHDLFDQLNLIQLWRILDARRRSKPITLICIDRVSGPPRVQGLGELEPRDLAALFKDRRPVDAAQIALATTSVVGVSIAGSAGDRGAVEGRHLGVAFSGCRARTRHLEEFPSDADGLSVVSAG
jgi:hypothetical protein